MSEDQVSYSNYVFGTFSLTADALKWTDHDGNEGSMAYADVNAICLKLLTNSNHSPGGGSLHSSVGGTTITTISASDSFSGSVEDTRIMDLKSAHGEISITMNPVINDDASAFSQFVTILHRRVLEANPEVVCEDATSVIHIAATIFITVFLLLPGGVCLFVGKIGDNLPFYMGGALFVVGAFIFFIWAVIYKRKAKPYNPKNIPADFLKG